MPKKQPELFFINILVSIDKIKRHTSNLSVEQFISSEAAFAITARELQEIGESIKKISKNSNLLENSNIEREKIIAFRNVVVHEYFKLIPEIIFDIVKEEIPKLEKKTLQAIKQQKDKTLFLQAIKDTKSVLNKMNRHESIAYLDNVEAIIKNPNH
ncbi:DUF86 domain-containing protein [Candidatus Dependentiae bacterium]